MMMAGPAAKYEHEPRPESFSKSDGVIRQFIFLLFAQLVADQGGKKEPPENADSARDESKTKGKKDDNEVVAEGRIIFFSRSENSL